MSAAHGTEIGATGNPPVRQDPRRTTPRAPRLADTALRKLGNDHHGRAHRAWPGAGRGRGPVHRGRPRAVRGARAM